MNSITLLFHNIYNEFGISKSHCFVLPKKKSHCFQIRKSVLTTTCGSWPKIFHIKLDPHCQAQKSIDYNIIPHASDIKPIYSQGPQHF